MFIIKQDFPFSHNGYEVVTYAASDEPQCLTEECAALAVAEGWAVPADADKATKPRANKARAAAPENKGE